MPLNLQRYPRLLSEDSVRQYIEQNFVDIELHADRLGLDDTQVFSDGNVWAYDITDKVFKPVRINPYRAKAYKTGNQALTTGGSGTDITFSGEAYDADAIHSAGIFTVPAGLVGLATVSAFVEFASNASGIRNATIQVDTGGGYTNVVHQSGAGHGTLPNRLSLNADMEVSGGEKFKLRGFQSSGGNLNVTGGTESDTWFAIKIVPYV